MNFDLAHSIVNDIKNNKFVQNFMKELQNSISKNSNMNIEKEDMPLVNPTHNGEKITAEYRDKMLTERARILDNYAIQTLDKGEMYYIYSKNSKMSDVYNLCICEEEKSHTIIEVSRVDLPDRSRNWKRA